MLMLASQGVLIKFSRPEYSMFSYLDQSSYLSEMLRCRGPWNGASGPFWMLLSPLQVLFCNFFCGISYVVCGVSLDKIKRKSIWGKNLRCIVTNCCLSLLESMVFLHMIVPKKLKLALPLSITNSA